MRKRFLFFNYDRLRRKINVKIFSVNKKFTEKLNLLLKHREEKEKCPQHKNTKIFLYRLKYTENIAKLLEIY